MNKKNKNKDYILGAIGLLVLWLIGDITSIYVNPSLIYEDNGELIEQEYRRY